MFSPERRSYGPLPQPDRGVDNDITFESARLEDIDDIIDLIAQISIANFQSDVLTEEDLRVTYDGQAFRDRRRRQLKNAIQGSIKAAVFVARSGKTIVGYGQSEIKNRNERHIHVYAGGVKGIGRSIFDRAIAWHGDTEDIYTDVVATSVNAIGFHIKNGFEDTGKRWDFKLEDGKPLPQVVLVRRANNRR
jgi:hypothetical protein